MELTHASFFSGVGGLDLGLERAGWRTVSFSEIDPYASAVLAERWPGIPNLGDIVDIAGHEARDPFRDQRDTATGTQRSTSGLWHAATLWSGGFPCQDLSVAGKRRGMGTVGDRTRSGLAYAFLDLVERHRPPAILLENVPGLLSSNGGKDFGALLSRLGELGYWWAYRILDAQYFGVPQRRRRVFICALHAGAGFGADSPAAVLSVGSRCEGHSAAGDEAGPAASDGLAAGFARSLSTSQWRIDADTESFIVGSSPDSGGVREADGLAGRLDDRVHPSLRAGGHGSPGIGRDGDEGRLVLSPTLRVGPQRPQDGGPGDTVPIVISETGKGWWTESEQTSAFRAQGGGTPHHAVIESAQVRTSVGSRGDGRDRAVRGMSASDDPLLPLGLDSHRYRCCGNGVVSNVSEWIGVRLARAFA